jgi:hypothetical protein
MNEPDFAAVPPVFLEAAWEEWNNGDVGGLLCLVGHNERGRLLMDNLQAFKNRGIYEEVLFETYTHGPCFPISQWRFLFMRADRKKLRTHGDCIPTESITVYRGVTHHGHKRWIRGVSWTTNKGTAAWFANRHATPAHSPAVYSLRVSPEAVLFSWNGRKEEEVAVAAWECGRMKRMDTMPEAVKPE